MTVQIPVGSELVPFILDREHWKWHSAKGTAESEFPLITVFNGKRYELYSDETFAEAEE